MFERLTLARPARWAGRAVAVAAGLGVALAGAVSAPAANASEHIPHTNGPGYEFRWGDNHFTWMGAFDNPDPKGGDWLAWCKEIYADAPAAEDFISSTDMGSNEQMIDLAGPDMDLDDNAQMAWILSRYEGVETADSRGAIASIVHLNFDATISDDWQDYWGEVQSDHPEVAALARRYVAEAKRSTLHSYGTVKVSGDRSKAGSITGISALSHAGQTIAGIPVKVELEGPAAFADGSKTWSGTSQAAPISLAWHATGNGKVSYKTFFTYRNGTMHVHSSDGYQDVLYNELAPKVLAGPVGGFRVVKDFKVLAGSDVKGAKRVSDYAHLSDTLKVWADPGYGAGQWIRVAGKPVPLTFTATIYRMGDTPSRAGSAPKGAQVIGSARVVASGPGTYKVKPKLNAKAKSQPGFVTWVWKMDKAAQGKYSQYLAGSWSDGYGVDKETSLIPFKPSVSSAIKIVKDKGQDKIGDDVWVRGIPTHHGTWRGTHGFKPDSRAFTQTLYFFPKGLAVSEANKARALKIGSSSIPSRPGYHKADKNGLFAFKTDAHGNRLEGTYVFVTSFSGDDRVGAFTSPVTDPKEQFTQSSPSPRLRTTATAQDGGKEVKPVKDVLIHDRVCYEHLLVGHKYRMVGELMDKASEKPVLENGKPVTQAVEFKPKAASGCVMVDFKVNGEALQGRSVVAFERAYQNQHLVAVHTDIKDQGQSVHFAHIPPKPPVLAQTGASVAGLGGLLGLLLASAGGALWLKRRKRA